MAVERFEIEATFIRTWVADGIFDVGVPVGMSGKLYQLGLDLTDVNYILKTGTIFRSDMLEDRGLWSLRAETVDGVRVVMTIVVNSSEYRLSLYDIYRE